MTLLRKLKLMDRDVVATAVVVRDNPSCFHLTNEVMCVFKEDKIVTEELPANCTAFFAANRLGTICD
jgi:hypothetical protein